MKLISFSVTNYRSIITAYKLPLTNSTVLIGPNNEGKSNLLKALVTSLDILKTGLKVHRVYRGRLHFQRNENNYDWIKDYPISLQEEEPEGKTTFKLELELNEKEIEDFHTEVESALNGTLPIELSLGKDTTNFRVVKRGPGGPALSKKEDAIAQFISKRIDITYIPAIRTSDQASDVVSTLINKELYAVEQDKIYKNALSEIAKLQATAFERISKDVTAQLAEFLPKVKEVKIFNTEESRFRALRSNYQIIVDDGTPTSLARKGDGVQSLAALCLMRNISRKTSQGKELILAIEEPESHLHPKAIQQLRNVLADISKNYQIIMTTHCPLLVDRMSIKSNIIVSENEAKPARKLQEIREILGVRAADNLQHAELVLLVEGEDDKRALTALFKKLSPSLNQAINQRVLVLDSLLGGSNLSYKISQTREAMCAIHSFLDNDKAGINAIENAQRQNLLETKDYTLAKRLDLKESELEDLYDEELYETMLQNTYGVSLKSSKFKGKSKWSDRIEKLFKSSGKNWNDSLKNDLKNRIANLVEAKPEIALNDYNRSAFDALVTSLTVKLDVISKGR